MESFPSWQLAIEAKGKKDTGKTRPKSKSLFPAYFESWIPTYSGRTARGFSETTRPEYERPIRKHVLPRWRTLRMGEAETKDVKNLYADMRKAGATTSEIKKTRAALSVLFATATEDGDVPANIILGVRIPAPPDAKVIEEEAGDEESKALSRAELKLLLEAMPPSWVLFVEFLVHTGVRISEAVGLRWEHLDLGESPKVLVREQFYKDVRKKLKTKNAKRDLPLSPGMADRLLRLRRDSYGGPKAPVFTTNAGTELRPSNVYRRVLAPTAIAIGLKVEVETDDGETRDRSAVSFHSFRHTCASLLFDEGKNIVQVSKWLGHADPGFTLRTYVHLMDEGLGDATFLDGALGSKAGKRKPRKHTKIRRTRSAAKPAIQSRKREGPEAVGGAAAE